MKFFRFAPLAPLCLALAGCPSALSQYSFNSPGEFDQNLNARVAYVTVSNADGDASITDTGKVRSGVDSATITADGANASLALPQTSPVSNQQVARDHAWDPTEFYGDQHNSIVVERTPGLNEQDDTFLTYHEQSSASAAESPQVRQLARGYAGTRSDASVIADLRSRTSHSATYSGTGSAYVGQGDYEYSVDGTLQMTAQFAGGTTGISGNIVQTTAFDPATNPNGVNRVTFTGQFIDNSPDYTIGNIKLGATGAVSTENPDGQIAAITNGGGVGSFFGAHAQGTMGAFAGTGETSDPHPSPVTVIGSFQGKTADNN